MGMKSNTALVLVPKEGTRAMAAREAHELAVAATREHIAELTAQIGATQRLALEVAGGGSLYPNGVREAARILAGALEAEIHRYQVRR